MKEKDYRDNIGATIFFHRSNQKMTRAELGKKVNLHETTVKKYEDGKIKNIDIKKLIDFSIALGIPKEDLIGWTDEKEHDEFQAQNISQNTSQKEKDEIFALMENDPDFKNLVEAWKNNNDDVKGAITVLVKNLSKNK